VHASKLGFKPCLLLAAMGKSSMEVFGMKVYKEVARKEVRRIRWIDEKTFVEWAGEADTKRYLKMYPKLRQQIGTSGTWKIGQLSHEHDIVTIKTLEVETSRTWRPQLQVETVFVVR
jgi:alpha-amylase/alpha-mannosidase (GH57 family)